jgi:hypothetical protein
VFPPLVLVAFLGTRLTGSTLFPVDGVDEPNHVPEVVGVDALCAIEAVGTLVALVLDKEAVTTVRQSPWP